METRKILSPYRQECSVDPKTFTEKYLKTDLKEDVEVELLPIGFIVYLGTEDYKIAGMQGHTERNDSAGVVLHSNSLPKELRGHIILIDRGNGRNNTQQEINSTRKHEIRHILFNDFHAQRC